MTQRIVLAYSGGFTSSVAIPWLIEFHGADVVAVVLDLGQRDNLVEVRARALAAGALRCHVLDVRDAFATDFVLPTLRAQALMDGVYPASTAIGRPLIAQKLVEIARIEQATVVAHGSTGRDQARLEGPIRGLDAGLETLAVATRWSFDPPQLAAYAEQRAIPGAEGAADQITADRNLWGRTIAWRADDVTQEPPESLFVITRPAERTSDAPAFVDIGFERGRPTQINGVGMPFGELIDSLSTIAAEHGVGRLERLKPRAAAPPSRALYEAPAAVVLHQAHADLSATVASGRLARVTKAVASAYTDVIVCGDWNTRLRRALDGFVDHAQEPVSGVVRVKVFKGGCHVVSRSPSAA